MKRIKYVSRFASPLTREQVDAIVKQSAANNAKRDITGVLMTSGELFFQILEGPDEAIDALYATIEKDPRHTDVWLLKSEHDIPRRIFPEWSMNAMVLDAQEANRLEPLRAILETIVELHDRTATLSNILGRALWSELSAASRRPAE